MSVTLRDNGYAALLARMRAAAKPVTVTVGVHEDKGSELHAPARGQSVSGATIAEVATWAEFGTSRAPARPWLSSWVDQNVDRNKNRMRGLLAAVVKGQIASAQEALSRFGERAQFEIVRRIGDGIDPANAPSTVARKKSALPLVDSGDFRKAVDFKVNGEGT